MKKDSRPGLLQHFLAALSLPVVVAAGVPGAVLVLGRAWDSRWSLGWPFVVLPIIIGLGLCSVGLALSVVTVRLFATVGRGTLAPWEPPTHLVIAGPYRYVRNPMIAGVIAILLGEACTSGSWLLGAWAALVFTINHVYFILSEEPGLVRRFGEEYRTYARHVPRWIPRLHPWTPTPGRGPADDGTTGRVLL